jgi:hypothetical protein
VNVEVQVVEVGAQALV